ncbi:glycine cleavage system H protein, mitochondrial [Athalia rosae]|uniref:glycine cleavage system H protein, mitochondrial n=1 Tax=Athalia rosae TaxID=37344 RepID=UPI000625E2CF|nr:glycine cleavage system H protein, mitochondrial [Athalia rosae]XP_048507301.1 glycine cleavage system H protein, mitochondrial [Athalia rosae]
MAQIITQVVRCTVRTVACVRTKQMFSAVPKKSSFILRGISTSRCMSKTDRLFTEKHEWVEVHGKVGTIGISHYAQDSLGDVVYAQLPDVGTSINQKDECGALESVKAASELYSPVSGKVVEKNVEVESSPGLINTSCYEKGWLFKVELTDPEELKTLMDEKAYDQFLKTDSH